MLAIIGGAGLTRLSTLAVAHREVVRTPYGEPSAALIFGQLEGREGGEYRGRRRRGLRRRLGAASRNGHRNRSYGARRRDARRHDGHAGGGARARTRLTLRGDLRRR